MAWTTVIKYKTRLGLRPDDTRITSLKPLDNGMPSSPVPFITPSGLVSFQHDLKARITSSPLVKVPLTMRPHVRKRSSNPFSLSLKRHSTTIFSRSSSSSSGASASAGSTPTSEMADPLCLTDMVIDLPSETPLHIAPPIGSKILDRFWPEDEASYAEESCRVSVPGHYPIALAPPPHHRRASRSLSSVHDVPFSDYPPWTSNEQNSGPLRFPF